MMADAHKIKHSVLARLDSLGWDRGRYLIGRSLGGLSALELAATDPSGLRGVIMESSAANLRGWTRFAVIADPAVLNALLEAQRERLQGIRLPLLTIHGEMDELIPVERAIEAHDAAGAEMKELLIVPARDITTCWRLGSRTTSRRLPDSSNAASRPRRPEKAVF